MPIFFIAFFIAILWLGVIWTGIKFIWIIFEDKSSRKERLILSVVCLILAATAIATTTQTCTEHRENIVIHSPCPEKITPQKDFK